VNDWHLDWERVMPADLGPGATRAVRDDRGFPHLRVDGMLLPGASREALGEGGLDGKRRERRRDPRYWDPRPGEDDPAARLVDMDEMGIDVAVLFGGHCFLVASIVESPEIATATLRAYNATWRPIARRRPIACRAWL